MKGDCPSRALVVAPSWVGDAAMCTPALRAVRAAWRGAELVLVCRPGVDALLGNLEIADRLVVDRMGGVTGPFRCGRALRAFRPDAAILFSNSFRVALAARVAGAGRIIGFARDGRTWLLTDRVPRAPRGVPVPAVDAYCELVERALGVPVGDRRLVLRCTDAERAAATAALAGVTRPYALLVPGGNRADKRWPADRFGAVADAVAERLGMGVVVSGSPGERAVARAVVSGARSPIVDLTERRLDLGALKAIVAGASLVVTNDTGPRHLAAAFGIPTVVLFGPTDHRWTSLHGATERLLVAEPFLPEELVADRHARACRIDRIAVEDVVRAIETLDVGAGAVGESGANP